MTAAVIVLAHTRLDRVLQLVRALVAAEFRVAVHIDARTKAGVPNFEAKCAELDEVIMVPRVACEWGRYSLVEASLTAAEHLMARWPDTSHVVQISGSCLPVRPLADLRAHLDAHPDTCFIESVPADEGAWVKDGLSRERFTLYFPFSWQRQRRLFDKSVALQRGLGIRRKVVHDLKPHIGSQWWCLTGPILKAILTDPQRADFDRYFRLTWIPDEAYFQSLARRHGAKIVSKSLTFHRFDPGGRPYILYDDHLDGIRQLDHFFARKVWPGANHLYQTLLSEHPEIGEPSDFIDVIAEIERAEEIRTVGRDGLLMQSRFPSRWYEPQPSTVRPYYVFEGFDQAMPAFRQRLQALTGVDCYDRLFADRSDDAPPEPSIGPGNLSQEPRIRDYNPIQWLTALIWNTADAPVAFLFDVTDSTRLASFILKDPNARLYRLSGDAVSSTDVSAVSKLRLKHIVETASVDARASLSCWTKAAFDADPELVLKEVAATYLSDLRRDRDLSPPSHATPSSAAAQS